MRLLIISSSLLFASIVHSAGLARTYVIENPQGTIVAKLEVKGDRLSGNINIAGETELKLSGAVKGETASGTVISKDGSGGDARLVGTWSHKDLIVSGNASFASEEHMAFRADGTYVYGKGDTAAGGKAWSFDGGKGSKVERGRWRAQDGILFVMGQNGEWIRAGKYGMTDDGRTM